MCAMCHQKSEAYHVGVIAVRQRLQPLEVHGHVGGGDEETAEQTGHLQHHGQDDD